MGKKDEGILLVVSGPSGAGKGTICNEIRNIYPELNYSISMTTRTARVGEEEGVSYFFRSKEEFERLIKEEAFLEYACVYGNYYGTPKKSVLDLIERGKSVLLEIDIQGAIHGRGTDSEDTIQKRLAQITGELSMAHKYDYIVVNDVLKDAVHKTCAIIEAERCKLSRNQNQIETIFQQYINKEVPLK